MVLYVLRADGVLAGHAVYNVHAVPMTGNNAISILFSVHACCVMLQL